MGMKIVIATHRRLFTNGIITIGTRALIRFGLGLTLAGGIAAVGLAGVDGFIQHNAKENVQIGGDLVLSRARSWEIGGCGVCHKC